MYVCEFAECSVKDVTKVASEAVIREQETQTSMSTCVSSEQNFVEVAEPVVEITEPITSSGSLQGNGEDRALGGGSEVSTEKHSISVEARIASFECLCNSA